MLWPNRAGSLTGNVGQNNFWGMSYDFRLFRPMPGEDPLVTARSEVSGFASNKPTSTAKALNSKVTEAIVAHNPRLRRVSIDDTNNKLRYVEINSPEGGNGIQIHLFDAEAGVTIPYSHEGPTAAEVFREVWSYLEIIHREAGYLVYDSQAGRVFDPSAVGEQSAALASYVIAVRQVRKTVTGSVQRRS